MRESTIKGRVTRDDTNHGVHGLTVEAWDVRPCEARCLGHDLTNRDGSYTIRFCEPEDGCDLEVILKVRDREGRVIHDGRTERCQCLPDAPATINVELASDTLWWHLASPLSWEAPDGNLIDPRVIDEVREAMALTSKYARSDRFLCIVPPIHHFDGLLRDAWKTLQGDTDAARRYRDALHALCGAQPCGCSTDDPFTAALEQVFAAECSPEELCPDVPEPPARRATCGAGCGCGCDAEPEPPCPCDGSIVSDDDVLLLFMGILHISCGHAPTAIRYAAVVLDQICRLQQLGALHAAATKALCGDADAQGHFSDLVDFIDAHCCGIAQNGRACSRPLGCCATCIDDDLVRCLTEAVCAWQSVDCYRISAIEPSRACPGDIVRVCGEGLGDVPGTVIFTEYGGIDPGPHATPAEWCCDAFSVQVPTSAGCGMSVLLPADTLRVCDRFLEYRPHGCIDAEFEGTTAAILKFNVEGRSDGDCVEPGTPLALSWTTCAADRVRVEVLDEDSGAVIASLNPAPDRGRWTFDGNGFTTTTRVRVQVIAEGICHPQTVERHLSLIYQARPDLSVQGLEVTQAIQHYRADQHLTDPADRGADNSLRLVTNKTAWVRTYLRSGQVAGFDGGTLPDVDGTLTVERRLGGIWGTVASIGSQNGSIDALDSFVNYDAERGNINSTLNFVIPATVMTGLLRLTVNVESPYDCPGNTAAGATTVDVNLQQTLNAAFITIGYDGVDSSGGGNLVLPAPGLAECQAETSWAMTTFPVSGAPNVRVAGTFVTNTPIDDPRSGPGKCSPNWGPLLANIASLVTLDQAANPGNWAYYGIIANGIPVNVPGCSGAATGGIAGQPPTYAHEIGHQFGLPHSRCGNAGTGNAAYPVYEPYDLPVDVPANPVNSTSWTMASIGEYGLDINNGNIANPNTVEDFMSYCSPRWISRFTHNYLVNDMRLDPVVVPTGSGAGSPRVISDDETDFVRSQDTIQPLVVLTGVVDAAGNWDVSTVARLATRYSTGTGRPSGFRAMLIGPDGEVLAEDVVYRFSVEGSCGDDRSPCCDDCAGRDEFMFKAMLDDVAPGSALRVTKDGETVWERSCPSAPPEVSRAKATVTKDGKVRVSWSAKGHGESESAWIRWSDDGGETWHALSIGVTERSVELPIEQAPTGSVMFEVFVHDGFHTVTATTATIEIAEQPPAVTILYPGESDLVYGEREIHLWGVAARGSGGPITDDSFIWRIDGEEVGSGADIWVDNPGVGHHELELSVASEASADGVAQTTFEVRE